MKPTLGTTTVLDRQGMKRSDEAYLARIAALTGVPIAMVSTGPDRDETILLHHPFH